MEEKVITLDNVLSFIAEAALVIAAVVAVFALIWGAWHTLRVALTVIVADLVCVGLYMFIDKLKEKWSSRE